MGTTKKLRVGFAGTPLFAAKHLEALVEDGSHELIAVWTQPDRPAGRGKQTQASPVKQLAEQYHIPVLQPQKLLSADQEEMADFNLDLLVVVAYGLILPQSVLDTPHKGCINVHASLLPRWRGAAPIQRAVEAGDTQTGVCIMQMDAGLDTGDVIGRTAFPIRAIDTAGIVHDRLIEEGAPLLIDTINRIATGDITAETQKDEDSCYAAKIHKAEAEINWQQDANTIDRKIRAFNPVPVAYTNIGKDRLRIWQAYAINQSPTNSETNTEQAGTIVACTEEGLDIACSDGLIRVKKVQLPGKKPVYIADLLRGNADKFVIGSQLGINP